MIYSTKVPKEDSENPGFWLENGEWDFDASNAFYG